MITNETYPATLYVQFISDEVLETEIKFYGSELEMQQMELILLHRLKPTNIYEQNCLLCKELLASSLTGAITVFYIIEIKTDIEVKVVEEIKI